VNKQYLKNAVINFNDIVGFVVGTKIYLHTSPIISCVKRLITHL